MKLALFFTEGVSLKTWNDVGMIDRELALYRALTQRGVEVSFVTYGGQDDLAYEQDMSSIQVRANSNDLSFGEYQRELVSRPPSGDIFKSNQTAGAEIALAAAQKAGAKFIARCGYLLSEFQERKYGRRSREAKAARKLEETAFGQADAVVVTTTEMADEVAKRYRLERKRIRVIPNYVETERFKPAQRSENERLRIAFVGRLDRQKNLRVFVKAVRDLDVDVRLIGYGPQREELEILARGSRAHFEFMGNVPNRDLPALLNQSDIFVLPSLYEGHPKALLEAMACGLPSIGTRVPGIQNVIKDGVTGLLCEPKQEALTASLNRLLKSADLRSQLATAGREYVVAEFALDRVVDLELGLYSELL